MNIVLIGMPGCGKSTIGKILAQKMELDFFDSDIVIEEKSEMTVSAIFEKWGEAEFRKRETAVLTELGKLDGTVISTGGGCVEYEENMRVLRQNGKILFIDRSPENILTDIDTSARPLLAGKAEHLNRLYERRLPLYEGYCDMKIDNNGNMSDTIEKIVKEIKKYENNGSERTEY